MCMGAVNRGSWLHVGLDTFVSKCESPLGVALRMDGHELLGVSEHSPQCSTPESMQVAGVTTAGIAGPVFIKFNARSGLCYCSRYQGRDRGVLVTFGQTLLGHFPLGIFDEAMSKAGVTL